MIIRTSCTLWDESRASYLHPAIKLVKSKILTRLFLNVWVQCFILVKYFQPFSQFFLVAHSTLCTKLKVTTSRESSRVLVGKGVRRLWLVRDTTCTMTRGYAVEQFYH